MAEPARTPLRRCGGLWKPKPGMSSKGSGSITVCELKQRFIVVVNDKKVKPEQPDYLLLAQGDAEPDTFVQQHRAAAPAPAVTDAEF